MSDPVELSLVVPVYDERESLGILGGNRPRARGATLRDRRRGRRVERRVARGAQGAETRSPRAARRRARGQRRANRRVRGGGPRGPPPCGRDGPCRSSERAPPPPRAPGGGRPTRGPP